MPRRKEQWKIVSPSLSFAIVIKGFRKEFDWRRRFLLKNSVPFRWSRLNWIASGRPNLRSWRRSWTTARCITRHPWPPWGRSTTLSSLTWPNRSMGWTKPRPSKILRGYQYHLCYLWAKLVFYLLTADNTLLLDATCSVRCKHQVVGLITDLKSLIFLIKTIFELRKMQQAII